MSNLEIKVIGQLMRLSDIEDAIGFKRSKIYRLIDKGDFPPAKKYGSASKWWSTQIEYFLLFQSWSEQEWSKWVETRSVS